jgi:hypothetical protein
MLVTKAQTAKPFIDFPVEREKTVNPITQYGKTFETALQHIFPAKQEETRIQKARLIMGDVYLTNFQYLIDSWLDEYEKQVFDNKTLKEKLKEG